MQNQQTKLLIHHKSKNGFMSLIGSFLSWFIMKISHSQNKSLVDVFFRFFKLHGSIAHTLRDSRMYKLSHFSVSMSHG